MHPHAYKPRRGRPRDPAIARRIIEGAQFLFATRAFDAVAMNDIASRAGTCKSTIYFYFRDKQELFDAALDDLLAQLPAAIDLIPAQSHESVHEQLLGVAHRVRNLLASVTFELIQRTLASNIAAPARERIWTAAGYPYVEAITGYLRAQAERGALRLADARSAAALFITLIVGGRALGSQLNVSSFGFSQDDHLSAAVGLFIRAHAGQPACSLADGRHADGENACCSPSGANPPA